MLKTKKGTTLPAELFLHTVTSLGYEPGMLENLAQTSKVSVNVLQFFNQQGWNTAIKRIGRDSMVEV